MVGEREIDGHTALTIAGEAAGGIEVAFVPGAGMVGASLRHRGEELLGQRGGLARYVEKRSTMGIPLLFPWANRLSSRRFELAGREVDLDRAEPAPSDDGTGLPIHGLLSAAPGWEVERHEEEGDGGVLRAAFDLAAAPGLVAAFPFPQRIEIEARLKGTTLTIETTISAGEAGAPISFGFHPYLTLPGVPRSEWGIELPVSEQVLLDGRGIPTGQRAPADVASGPLGERTFDDAYLAPADGAPFVLSGGGRRIELSLGEAFGFCQLYAPANDEVIAFEPMTAPTDALISGAELRTSAPGEAFGARFSLTVRDI